MMTKNKIEKLKKIAVVQFSTKTALKENIEKVEAMMAEATNQQADMILFPEEFLTHKMSIEEKKSHADTLDKSKLVDALSRLSKKHEISLLAGTLPILNKNNNNQKYYNASVLFDDSGKILAAYHKIHLFDVKTTNNPNQPPYQESQWVEGGKECIVADTIIGKLGLSICYDIRFPELYRKQVQAGAQILAIPSAFTVETGEAHWEILLRARAIENLSYVLAPAQMGERYDGRKTYGHAMIVSPWGEIIQQGIQEGIIYTELDLEAQQGLRTRFPALTHIKLI
jgi:nitrilase